MKGRNPRDTAWLEASHPETSLVNSAIHFLKENFIDKEAQSDTARAWCNDSVSVCICFVYLIF